MAIVLSVDAMGGDNGIQTTVPATLRFLKENPDVKAILVGDKTSILAKFGREITDFSDRIEIEHTVDVVAMDESPQVAMRLRNSSMRIAINMVKENRAQVIISAGNTGALMAISRYVLHTIDGIDRPAIAKIMPTMTGEVCVLDLGANIDSTAEHLFQFAMMGSAVMGSITNKTLPSIGLLNIGSEEIKGREVIKEAAVLLKNSKLNFYGNVEGNDINKGTVDVVVCDGFTGNVTLKTIEGVAKMISTFLKEEFTRSVTSKLMAIIASPVLNRLKARLDPRKYNGALLVGLNALVVKSHGGADEIAFYYALSQGYHETRSDVIARLKSSISSNANIIS